MLLCYSTHKVFKSHVKSSQADFLYSSVLLKPTALLAVFLQLTAILLFEYSLVTALNPPSLLLS
jgi:hypothetical protein